MKTNKVFSLALILTTAWAVSAEAGDHHNNYSGSQIRPSRGRSGTTTFSRPVYRYSNSSIGVRPMPRFREQRSTFSSTQNFSTLNQRRFTESNTFNRNTYVPRTNNTRNFSSIQGNHFNRFASNNQNFRRADTTSHVFARQTSNWHPEWDRHSDHWWHGHRCHWFNGSWIIFDVGFFPWFGWPYYDYYAYDYGYPYSYDPYGYGGYGYSYGYDPGAYAQPDYYYDQGGYDSYNQPNNYNPGRYNNYDQGDKDYPGYGNNSGGSYDRSPGALVADVQALLAREGYYRGKIDGVMGPETRHALVRYQSSKGLAMTGELTLETRKALGLGNEIARDGGDE